MEKLKERVKALNVKLEKYKRDCQENGFLSSSENRISKLNLLLDCMVEDGTVDGQKLVLKEYTQALMDLTFFQEGLLVDKEFSGETAETEVLGILDAFIEVEQFCIEIMNSDVEEIIGIEQVECLHWRKGALLYMYCNIRTQDKTWIKNHQDEFFKFLSRGVEYLKIMLSTRHVITVDTKDDHDVLKLLQHGIFSDTHMLALMYGAEMCYWYVYYTKMWNNTEDTIVQNASTLQHTGVELLQLYVKMVEGPLNGLGWNCDRARELLDYLMAT
ncbi:RAB7A-interacting MON1-CCZ1 complex subunit 1-like isoform X1 [Tachypleus tridentatus]|uniref:RAB7A-interacting MON1-CCZ1 complex subunit 1-like isoform X1 n=2 Tax=Tachypleus tridentatus TaxID=6853 RepID=UPI003FD62DA8